MGSRFDVRVRPTCQQHHPPGRHTVPRARGAPAAARRAGLAATACRPSSQRASACVQLRSWSVEGSAESGSAFASSGLVSNRTGTPTRATASPGDKRLVLACRSNSPRASVKLRSRRCACDRDIPEPRRGARGAPLRRVPREQSQDPSPACPTPLTTPSRVDCADAVAPRKSSSARPRPSPRPAPTANQLPCPRCGLRRRTDHTPSAGDHPQVGLGHDGKTATARRVAIAAAQVHQPLGPRDEDGERAWCEDVARQGVRAAQVVDVQTSPATAAPSSGRSAVARLPAARRCGRERSPHVGCRAAFRRPPSRAQRRNR